MNVEEIHQKETFYSSSIGLQSQCDLLTDCKSNRSDENYLDICNVDVNQCKQPMNQGNVCMHTLLFQHRHNTKASLYKNIFLYFSFKKLGPIQEALKVSTSTDMKLFGFCVLYAHGVKQPQAFTLNITVIGSSVLFSCEDSLLSGLVAPRLNLEKITPKVQLITSITSYQQVNKL